MKKGTKKLAGLKCLHAALFLGMLFLCAGCTAGAANRGLPKSDLFWPPLPLEPRIGWVMEIHDPRDAGIGKGFWRRVVEFITGDEEDGIGKPYGVFVDSRERLFVSDVANSAVHVFDLKEKTYTLIGSGDKRLFRTPIGITGDGDDTVFITDSGAGTVYSYGSRTGKLAPLIAGVLARPTGIAFNAGNRLLYIADTGNHQIAVFDLKGAERFRIGRRGESPGEFNYPTDLFIDSGGDLYVTDALNARIQVFSPSGKFLRAFGKAGDSAGYFAKPKGVAVDSEGHIYVCDALQDSVQIFDGTGRLLLDFGTTGAERGQFFMPAGIFIDRSDTVYVADSYNRRVQIFNYLKSDSDKPALSNAAPK